MTQELPPESREKITQNLYKTAKQSGREWEAQMVFSGGKVCTVFIGINC